jgi:hypothetical protein
MRYLGASGAALAVATTISLTPLGRTARAKPVVRSGMDTNAILPFSASSSSTITRDIDRYGGKEKKPTLLQMFTDSDPETCKSSAGAWTHTDTQNCGKDASGKDVKCGKVTTRTVTVTEVSRNQRCPGIQTIPYAAIYYDWTAHNNQNINASALPKTVTDTFNATWTSPDYTEQFTFTIAVPMVRSIGENTVFERWSPDNPTVGEWKQKLVPPSSDPTFDFSGEHVLEAVGGVGQDSC